MGMCIQNAAKTVVLLIVFLFLGGCEAIENILPASASAYKVNAHVNNISLDELSFVSSNDRLRPIFEESVSNDPDVTALMVYLKNSREEITGWKVIYRLASKSGQNAENSGGNAVDAEIETLSGDAGDLSGGLIIRAPGNYSNGDELIVTVKSLDGELPFFPVPDDLPIGRYTFVTQVMSGDDNLQKNEKAFFYIGSASFSFDGVYAHLPGITTVESPQLIPKGTVVMLEARLNYDRRLDPYIVWYNGRRKISEGKISNGAGQLFWKAPEQSGFFYLRAEIFPAGNSDGLAGYQNEVSLLVTSRTVYVHLVSEDVPQLMHWYIFEGNLNDSKMITAAEQALRPAANNNPKWISANGTYGLATGFNNIFTLPKVLISNNTAKTWQTLFRFNSLNDGVIFSCLFGLFRDVSLILSKEGQNLVLTLSSFRETVSRNYPLPALYAASDRILATRQSPFITAGITFSILPGSLSAKVNIIGDILNGELAAEPVFLEAEIRNEFQILLGFNMEDNASVGEPESLPERHEFTVLWDEFALYDMPPAEILTAVLRPREEQQESRNGSFN